MYRRIFLLLAGFSILIHGGCQAGQTRSGPSEARRIHSFALNRPSTAKTPEPLARALPKGAITLRDALAYALTHNPDLKAFSFEVRAAEARALQAGLRPNPEITVEIEEFGGAGARSGFDSAETTIQLGQLIELGGKRAKRIRLASLDEERTRWDYESVRLDVMKEVTQAYIAVLAAQERAALNEKVLEVIRKERSTVTQRVEAGKDPPVEELRANVALSRSEIEAKKAGKALATARHTLAAALGRETIDFKEVTGDFYTIPPVPSIADVADAVTDSPDLERWAAEERKRRAAVDLEKARSTSAVTISGGVRYYEEGDDTALVMGVALPIPLFNRNQGGVEEAMENLAKTREQYKAAKVERAAALVEALNRLAGTYDEVAALQTDVLSNAQRAFETAYQGYKEGKFDYLYVLDTQRTLFEIQAQYIDALETYHAAWADVERLIGRPLRNARPVAGDLSTNKRLSKEMSHEK
jgi:cobalt-zinc-cadmium efflux system outer membrane protein